MAYATTINSDTTKLFMKTGADTWLELADVVSVGLPTGFAVNQIDVTHLGTPGNSREFTGGRSTPSSVSVTIRYQPGSDTVDAIRSAEGQTRDFRNEYPNGIQAEYKALVQAWDPGSAAVDQAFEGTLTLQISGTVAESEIEDA